MEIFILFILGVLGLAVASKIVSYTATTAFFEAKYNFIKKLTNKEENENIKRS